jgi:MFS family permease
MVDRREDLANAIALNSTMVHGARFIGPAIGGYLIYKVGPALCFGLDGCSYLGVIAALMAMRVKPRPPKQHDTSVLHDLNEGLQYIWASKPILVMLLLMTTLSLTGMPALTTLMPVFATYFGGDAGSARMLGILMGASGLGAMIAAIYLASRKTVIGLGRIIAIASVLFGLAILGFSLSNHLWLSLLIVPIAGVGMLMSFASANTLIQTLTDDHMRGRVMSFFTMAFVGMAPWGNLIAALGAKALGAGVPDIRQAEYIGAARMLTIAGSVVIVAGIIFAMALPGLRRLIRPIYIRKGIIVAPVVEALETVADVVSGPER